MLKKVLKTSTACIYARVSTEEQRREGFSIPAQLKMLREYSEKNGFKVLKEFQDNETAKSTGRTGFNAMLSLMDSTADCRVILVEKTDRLTRNMKDYLALDLEKTGIEIHFVRDGKIMSRESSPGEHFIQDIEIAQAAYISRNISAEAKKGMKAKAEAGWYPSSAPLGYKNTQNSNDVKIIVPDEKAAPMVRLIFEKYSSGGMAIKDISKLLHENGFRTKRGNRVSTSCIHKMLKNPIYKGRFIWNGIEYDGNHEPIVSSALWYEVHDMLVERSVEKPKQTVQFPYTGIMKCGHCGCSITAERRKGKYSYYHCTFYRGKHGEPHTREEKLDEQFSETLKSISIDKDVADWILGTLERSTRDRWESLKETRERLVERREKLLRRSELLYDDRLEGRISASRYDDRIVGNKRELELVDEKLETLTLDSFEDPLDYARGIIELGQTANSSFVTAPADEKKLFLQNGLSNCTLRENRIHPEFAEPFARIADANAIWRATSSVNRSQKLMHAVWHPKANSNSTSS